MGQVTALASVGEGAAWLPGRMGAASFVNTTGQNETINRIAGARRVGAKPWNPGQTAGSTQGRAAVTGGTAMTANCLRVSQTLSSSSREGDWALTRMSALLEPWKVRSFQMVRHCMRR